MKHNRFEPLVSPDGLVGAKLVEAFPLGEPAAFAELEQGGRMSGDRFGCDLEGAQIEVDADQGEQPARLSVTRPEDFIVPVRLFPTQPLDRIDLAQRGEKPGFEPLPLLAEQVPRMVDVHILGELPCRAAEDQEEGDEAGR